MSFTTAICCGYIDDFPVVRQSLESTPNISATWENWSLHIEPGNHPDDDVLLSEERIGDRMQKFNLVFISPRLHKVLRDNGITDFCVQPVQFE